MLSVFKSCQRFPRKVEGVLRQQFLAQSSARSQRLEPFPHPPRNDESLEALRSRLQYQSRKRGILETDLIFSTFTANYLKSLTKAQLGQLDQLLTENDWDVLNALTGKDAELAEQWGRKYDGIWKMLEEVTLNEGGSLRRMPPLDGTT